MLSPVPPVFPAPVGKPPTVLAMTTAGVQLLPAGGPEPLALALSPRHAPGHVVYLALRQEDALLLLHCLEEALTRPRP
jgi:hypothetical protein